MQLLVLSLSLAVCAIAAPAGLYEGVGAIYKGPDSETIIKGPDGSRITSHAEGAALATKEEPLKPIVGPAPPKEDKPKVEIKGAKAAVEPKKPSAGKAADEAAEEVVEIAEEVVAKRPKADAVIFALQEPEGYGFQGKGEVEFEAGQEKAGYWGEGEEDEGEGEEEEGYEEGDDEKEDYEPFVIKAY